MTGPLDNLSPWYKPESYEPFEPQEVKKQERRFSAILWLLLLIGVACLVWAISASIARAHMADRPEMDDWLMEQTNQLGAVCCDGEDVVRLSDSEWGVENGHYWAMHDGHKVIIPEGHVSPGGNRVSEALLWWWAGQPQCFKPSTFY